jgi:hypothetical protein
MCVFVWCAWRWGLRCSCRASSRVEAVDTEQDGLEMCVIACELVVWAIIVQCVRVCGLAD